MSTAIVGRPVFHTSARGGVWPTSDRPARPGGRLRMTRRGRMVLAVLVSLPLAAGTGVAIGAGDGAIATGAPAPSTFEYVRVESGQSLWQIASAIAPTADPRDVVSDIVRLNGLTSSDVVPGQRLAVPEQY